MIDINSHTYSIDLETPSEGLNQPALSNYPAYLDEASLALVKELQETFKARCEAGEVQQVMSDILISDSPFHVQVYLIQQAFSTYHSVVKDVKDKDNLNLSGYFNFLNEGLVMPVENETDTDLINEHAKAELLAAVINEALLDQNMDILKHLSLSLPDLINIYNNILNKHLKSRFICNLAALMDFNNELSNLRQFFESLDFEKNQREFDVNDRMLIWGFFSVLLNTNSEDEIIEILDNQSYDSVINSETRDTIKAFFSFKNPDRDEPIADHEVDDIHALVKEAKKFLLNSTNFEEGEALSEKLRQNSLFLDAAEVELKVLKIFSDSFDRNEKIQRLNAAWSLILDNTRFDIVDYAYRHLDFASTRGQVKTRTEHSADITEVDDAERLVIDWLPGGPDVICLLLEVMIDIYGGKDKSLTKSLSMGLAKFDKYRNQLELQVISGFLESFNNKPLLHAWLEESFEKQFGYDVMVVNTNNLDQKNPFYKICMDVVAKGHPIQKNNYCMGIISEGIIDTYAQIIVTPNPSSPNMVKVFTQKDPLNVVPLYLFNLVYDISEGLVDPDLSGTPQVRSVKKFTGSNPHADFFNSVFAKIFMTLPAAETDDETKSYFVAHDQVGEPIGGATSCDLNEMSPARIFTGYKSLDALKDSLTATALKLDPNFSGDILEATIDGGGFVAHRNAGSSVMNELFKALVADALGKGKRFISVLAHNVVVKNFEELGMQPQEVELPDISELLTNQERKKALMDNGMTPYDAEMYIEEYMSGRKFKPKLVLMDLEILKKVFNREF